MIELHLARHRASALSGLHSPAMGSGLPHHEGDEQLVLSTMQLHACIEKRGLAHEHLYCMQVAADTASGVLCI